MPAELDVVVRDAVGGHLVVRRAEDPFGHRPVLDRQLWNLFFDAGDDLLHLFDGAGRVDAACGVGHHLAPKAQLGRGQRDRVLALDTVPAWHPTEIQAGVEVLGEAGELGHVS
ncbi:hypothetical protein OWR29_25575 [Actinoplanes sp. Pm04-4]|uniref:Uncharacterized protein n=1 Tax=Paractinoplanes pyxinae TaxID=2997416 RepID=A0ABT4B4F4_9ACTN|nr:hypothetical protein [Actinoplanes pyxinae]MCY1141383.1 hypothetical protein [Actinoplanes pyxinae]